MDDMDIDDSSYREKTLYTAKLAEEAGCYQDMANEMKSLVYMGADFTAEMRNLLSTAFKKLVNARRASLKKLRANTDIFTDVVSMDRMTRFQENVKKELEDICNDIVTIIDDFLIPYSQMDDDYPAIVFYLKTKGDFCRYAAEVTVPDWIDIALTALQTYEGASIIAAAQLPATHPTRLSLALSYSVYYYKIEGLPKRAVEIANEALDGANSGLDGLSEEARKDITNVMKLLSDNVAFWEREIAGNVANLNEGGIASI